MLTISLCIHGVKQQTGCMLCYLVSRPQKGLFMRKPLTRTFSKYVVPKALLRILERMRKHNLFYWSYEQYNELFGSN